MALPSYDCVLCLNGGEETLYHLLLGCSFAQEYWIHLGLYIDPDLEPFEVLSSLKIQLKVQFFMEIIIIMSWSIWMSQNDLIFKGLAPSVQDCLACFKYIFTLVTLLVKEDWKSRMLS
jgi:hypothetical protein